MREADTTRRVPVHTICKVKGSINGCHKPFASEREEEDRRENCDHPKEDFQFFPCIHSHILYAKYLFYLAL